MYYRPSTFRRLIAYLLDGGMAFLLFLPLLYQVFSGWFSDGDWHVSVLFFVLTYLSYLFFIFISYGFFSATVGKWLMGLRLVSVDEKDASLMQVFLRVLADQLHLFLGWGLFSLALARFDRRHVSDWVAETKVVQVVPDSEFPSRYVVTGLVLCALLSIEGWRSVQERWNHVELLNKQIYFEAQ